MFGRSIRNPLIGYNNPDFVYTAKPGQAPVLCQYLVQNSPRTVYVDCDGVTRLEHVDQLKEKLENTTNGIATHTDDICESDEEDENESKGPNGSRTDKILKRFFPIVAPAKHRRPGKE